MSDNTSDNLVPLDLSQFARADVDKVARLGDKLRLLYRWFRCERITAPGLDRFFIYSGSRGRTPYAAYRIARHRDGHYELANQRTEAVLAHGRTIDEVIDRLPEDFFYSD